MPPTQATRKQRGAWYTPADLVELVVEFLLDDLVGWEAGRSIRILDPACGDGRFLDELRVRLHLAGYTVHSTGCDIDADALAQISYANMRRVHADALHHDWGGETFDMVVGNPPYLSQMAISTTRGGASRHGGGPYADTAAEFLALAVRLADPGHGRVGLVLPQSILASRDAHPVREQVAREADLAWSWWRAEQRHFDASINVCALGFRRPSSGRTTQLDWTRVVTDQLGVPHLDPADLAVDGTVGDRSDLNANFRDEYYALVPAVGDDVDGPPLVTSGLIDPGVCHWGVRPVKFAKRNFDHPRVDLSRLTGRFPAWAERKLVPKVLVANQTRIVEAVADDAGAWIPGVPVTTVVPHDPASVWAVTAVLTSPIASALCWHYGGGTGLSTRSVRVGPAVLSAIPWPSGDLTEAVTALRDADPAACGRAVMHAFGREPSSADPLVAWWSGQLPV
ncbi:MAG: N-6 DNA methylase [Ilumatobacteraceae bacterium]